MYITTVKLEAAIQTAHTQTHLTYKTWHKVTTVEYSALRKNTLL